MGPSIPCSLCSAPLPPALLNAPLAVACPTCRAGLYVTVFPALLRPLPAAGGNGAVAADGESSCFYHPAKRAAALCESCGRFLCSLCDIELAGRHTCSACIESGKRNGRTEDLSSHRFVYDEAALGLALLPLLLWPFTLITAPLTLFVVLRYWKTPSGVIPRSKVRFILAFFFATLQIAAWMFLFAALIK